MPATKGGLRNRLKKAPQLLVSWEFRPRALWENVRLLFELLAKRISISARPRVAPGKGFDPLLEWESRPRAVRENLRLLLEMVTERGPVPAQPRVAPGKGIHPLLEWESRPRALWENLQLLFRPGLRRVVIPAQLRTVRAAWFAPRFPWRPMIASILLHFLIIVMPIRLFSHRSRPPVKVLLTNYELTWYKPADLLPPVSPFNEERNKPSPGGRPIEPLPPQGADVFHPRQTIISSPPNPNNNLLTLQQPDLESPPVVKPKPLPNIVLWARSPLPPAPQIELAVKKIAAPKMTFPVPKPAELPANLEPRVADINVGKSVIANLEPKLVVPPARTAMPASPGEAPNAPEMNLPAGTGDVDRLQRIIALSASPAPLAPVIEVPPGNLAAQFSVGPMGGVAGSPGGVPGGKAGAHGGTEGGPGGIAGGASGALIHAPDVYVSNAASTPPGLLGGVSVLGGEARPGNPSRSGQRPLEKGDRRELASASIPRGGITSPEGLTPGPPSIEQSILRGKKVYTLSINMPNLASGSGSWVLRFSEREDEPEKTAGNGQAGELTAPIAILKIDPKYNAEAVRAHIQGEVVLYAVIGKDGKVGQVQVLRGLDAKLDQNAVEAFRHWQFEPARKAGMPVDLEAVVTIPFRLAESF